MPSSRTLRRIQSTIFFKLKFDKRLQHWGDERYLKLLFRVRTGEPLDLERPRSFSEKLQWLKLRDRRPHYTTLVDKFAVKTWVAQRVGESFVVPNLGVWDSFDQIDFDQLPERFVLKCTHDSGGLVICDDPSAFDVDASRAKIQRALARNYYYPGREWPYKDVKPRILAEVYLPSWTPDGAVEAPDSTSHRDGVIDYKFYCFHGEPKFLYVSQGLRDHGTAKMDFVDLNWELTEFARPDYSRFEQLPPKPAGFDKMVEIARELSTNIPFVRVDLFEHCGKVLFSEMTFHPVSGMMPVQPRSADTQIGELLDLESVERS